MLRIWEMVLTGRLVLVYRIRIIPEGQEQSGVKGNLLSQRPDLDPEFLYLGMLSHLVFCTVGA